MAEKFEVWERALDDEVKKRFNLDLRSFSDWTYSQRITAILYIEQFIRENSRQGRRSDLVEEQDQDERLVSNLCPKLAGTADGRPLGTGWRSDLAFPPRHSASTEGFVNSRKVSLRPWLSCWTRE